ncbi:MAG: right-handed parallel beta-helix repeat-containing protein [Hyphomonadaceae bacterium]
MTLAYTDSRFSYDGDGTTTAFAFPRPVIEAAHLKVYLYDEDDNLATLQTLNTHYTFTGASLSNGIYATATITFSTAPGTDKKVVIYRDPSLTQEVDFTADTNVLTALNRNADRIAMQLQRLKDRLDRALVLPDGDYASSLSNTYAKAAWANKALYFDSSGNPVPTTPANASGTSVTSTGSTTARTLAERFADEINLLDWGVTLNSSGAAAANTAAINTALAYAYDSDKAVVIPPGIIYVAEASGSPGYCLLNEGVPMRGVGRNASIIAPVSTLGSSVSLMRIRPRSGEYIDFLAFLDFIIYQNISGSPKGKHGIHLLTDVTTNVNGLYMRGVYIAAGNDYSLRMENAGATNVQGCPANSTFEVCQFMEGVNATSHGDSLNFSGCTFRSTSTRAGIRADAVDTSGVAGALSIIGNNFDCAGGAIQIIRGRHFNILYNNIEHTAGAGANAAVIDLDGSSGTLTGKNIVRGNHIGIFGTSTATIGLRINATDDCLVEENDLEAGISIANGISITASASGVVLGPNTITGFSTAISNSGTGTLRRSTVPFTTVDNTLPRYDSTAGALQTSGVAVDDSNNVTGVASLISGGTITIDSAEPIFQTYESDAGSDVKRVWISSQAGVWKVRFVNDAANSATDAITYTRSGTAPGVMTVAGDLAMATGKRIDLQNSQTTVGGAGAASALPANPTGYIPIKVAGTEYVVPYYAKT